MPVAALEEPATVRRPERVRPAAGVMPAAATITRHMRAVFTNALEAGLEFAVLRMANVRGAALVHDLATAARKKLAADIDQRAELGQGAGTAADDGIPAAALRLPSRRRADPVRDFGHASPTTGRPASSYELLPQLAVAAGRMSISYLRRVSCCPRQAGRCYSRPVRNIAA